MISAYDRKRARSFGRSVGVVLLAVGAYQLARGRGAPGLWIGAGALLAALGTFAPAVLNIPSRVWWRVSHALGWVNSRVLLGVFFFAVLTPVGVIFRLIGRDPLSQKPGGTTWTPYPARPPKHYEHLF